MIRKFITSSIVAAGIGAVALAAGFAMLATGGAESASAAGPGPHVWPDYLQGKPYDFEAGARNGWYMWEGDTGEINVCSTTPSDRAHPFTATFTTDGRFVDVDKGATEAADDVRVTDGGHRLLVKFRTYDRVDCVSFVVDGGSRLATRMSEFGALVPASRINLGHDSARPPSNPFTIVK